VGRLKEDDMPYRLNKGAYLVRCRHARCTFNARLEIAETIMGMTESDVETEARKTARDMAQVKHDSLHGRHHLLHNPEIRMVSGNIQLTGAGPVQGWEHRGDSEVREFNKGDLILKEGEAATTVCEVLKGVAVPAKNANHLYRRGDCFGVASLLPKHRRMTDIVSGADKTTIAFYQLPELRKHDPDKAGQLFASLIEDTLKVIGEYERS